MVVQLADGGWQLAVVSPSADGALQSAAVSQSAHGVSGEPGVSGTTWQGPWGSVKKNTPIYTFPIFCRFLHILIYFVYVFLHILMIC